jgi:hypothetical protein
MAIRLVRWQGPARSQACALRVTALLSHWHGEWCAQGERPAAVPTSEALHDESGYARGAECGGASAWLSSASQDADALGAILVGEAQPDSLGLARRLAERAMADLLARLLSTTPDGLDGRGRPEADELDPRHGGLCFELSGPLVGWRLGIDAALCEALVPTVPMARGALSDLRAALAPETVTFDVAIPLGDMPLSESMSLDVGEVLLLGPLLEAEVRLLGRAGQAVAGGTLARAGEGRAIRIDHTLIKQGIAK